MAQDPNPMPCASKEHILISFDLKSDTFSALIDTNFFKHYFNPPLEIMSSSLAQVGLQLGDDFTTYIWYFLIQVQFLPSSCCMSEAMTWLN